MSIHLLKEEIVKSGMNFLVDLCWQWDKWISSDGFPRDCSTPGLQYDRTLLFQDRFCGNLHLNLKYYKSDIVMLAEMEHIKMSLEKQILVLRLKNWISAWTIRKGGKDIGNVSGRAGGHICSGP